jgi:tripartite-type tricarboxylate transporter receptor subunit TctC
MARTIERSSTPSASHWVRRLVSAAIVLAAAGLAASVHAQTYPSKPVKILTGYPPGGPTDVIGRVLADHMTAAMGQPFYVEGKPGAAGNVAGAILANSPPDGYTLYIVGLGIMAVNYDLYSNMTYDPAKAFAPITLLVNLPIVLEVNAKLNITTYKDFIAYAKSGVKLNHGSPGIGTLPHLAAELFKSKIGFESAHVPYRGSGSFATGMMQGEVQWAFDVTNTALTLYQNKFVNLLAVTSNGRYPSFPDTPSVVEVGIPDFVSTTWFGLVAPAATPKAIIDRLHAEIARGWAMPEVAQRLKNAGLDPATTTPEETAKIFTADRARWGAVVRANHITAE